MTASQKIIQMFKLFHSYSWIKKMRIIVMYLITILAYGVTIYLLFFQEEIIPSMVPLFVFFVFYHFAYLEIKHRQIWKIWVLFIIISLVEMLLLWFHTWQVPTSIIIFNTAIVILASSLKWASSGKRKFSAWWYFAVGGYIFTIFMTVAYSLFLIGWKWNFDLSCSNIEDTSNNFISTILTPFQIGKRQVQLIGDNAWEVKTRIQTNLKDIFTTNVGDILWFSKRIEIATTPEPSFGEKISLSIQKLKSNINSAVEEKLKLSMSVCDLVLKKIEQAYEHPAFQFTIVLLMFVLLFPFVRIAFWIISVVALLIFELLYLLWVYKKQKILEEVEEIL